ncbi:MAG: Gfo/Idh/MocA family protein [Rhizobiaceae bacterium]
MRRIGVGIIGLSAKGGWAATAHLPALRRFPEAEVVALSASSPESAAAAGAKHGIARTYHLPEDLAADPAVDLVVVAVKVPEHAALVKATIDPGKAVYCEWPLGLDLAEAQRLRDMAAAAGVRTFVGLQARAAPQVNFVRHLVASGHVGEVLSTTLIGSGSRWGATIPSGSLYLTDAANGATMLTIPFAHTLDAVEHVLGPLGELNATISNRRTSVKIEETGEMVAVSAPDQVLVSGRLTSGATIAAHYRGGLSTGTNFHWEINGTDGDILVTGPNGHLQYGQVRIQSATGGAKVLSDLETPASFERFPFKAGDFSYTVAHAYAAVLDDLATGGRTAPDFDTAVARHNSIDRIMEAARTGGRVSLQPA